MFLHHKRSSLGLNARNETDLSWKILKCFDLELMDLEIKNQQESCTCLAKQGGSIDSTLAWHTECQRFKFWQGKIILT